MPDRVRSTRLSSPPAEEWCRVGALWECPGCKRQYPRRQSHSCVQATLDDHFLHRSRIRELFDAFNAAIQSTGKDPVRLAIARSRIGFVTGMTFAAAMPRASSLRSHVVLARRLDSPRFVKFEHFPPYWLQNFIINDQTDIDAEVMRWLRAARRVGDASLV